MPNCNLTIEFYRPDRTYASGEKVNGWVRVNVDRNVRCRGLMLTARWETGGRGTPSRGNYWQETLYQGAWAPGELYEYPFEFPAPGGPFTYKGENFDLDHFVSVRADLPWAIETRTEKPFRLEPGSLIDPPRKRNFPLQHSSERTGIKWVTISGVAMLFAGLILMFYRQWIWGACAAIAGVAALIVFRNKIGIWNLNRMQWDLPNEMSPGENLPIRVRVGKGRLTAIRAMDVRLRAFEIVCTGPEKKRNIYRHEIFSCEYPLRVRSVPGDAGDTEFATDIKVLDIPAWSIDLPGNQIVWCLRLKIRQAWWPNWIESRHIQMIPALGVRKAISDVAGND